MRKRRAQEGVKGLGAWGGGLPGAEDLIEAGWGLESA